jgi:methylthioribulose-1-phosphate dehydratase
MFAGVTRSLSFDDAALALCEAGRQLYAAGACPATSGNFSMRLDAVSCAATVSGKHKGRLTPGDITRTDLSGRSLDGKKPSAEVALHVQLYRARADTGAVLHTHARASVVLSRALGPGVLRLSGYELLKAFEGITSHEAVLELPIFENTQDMASLAHAAAHTVAQGKSCAYLIAGHGAYTWASTLEACLRHAEALEQLLGYELDALKLRARS